MYLNAFYVLLVGFFIDNTSAGGKDKVHIKIHVPEFIHHNHHTKFVFLKDKKGQDHGYGGHGKKKVNVVLHKHEHNHKQKHDHGHKHAHKHGAKHDHKHNHKGNFKHQHEVKKSYGDKNSYNFKPFFDDGYKKSWKSLRTEKYETETIDNPHSNDPSNRFVVKSSYKVREKNPFDETTTGYDHEYQYPPPAEDYHKSAQIVDYYNAQNDPFQAENEDVKEDVTEEGDQKKQKKPAKYHYQSPADPYDYHKNVHLVDYYIAKNKHEVSSPHHESLKDTEKPKEYGNNEIDYDYSPEFQNYDYAGPSHEQNYQNYETDGPSFEYSEEFGDDSKVNEQKVPATS